MDSSELLRRLSATLRTEIGPAVDDEYTRTQAFMASVILERVAREHELRSGHDAAENADLGRLHPALEQHLASAAPVPEAVTAAVDAARASMTVAALGPVIDELYRWGHDDAAAALDLIRPALRADIDRRMEVAR
ncbi:MAG: hypothetical protein AAFN30_13245 [Actinomycetota bacterium]